MNNSSSTNTKHNCLWVVHIRRDKQGSFHGMHIAPEPCLLLVITLHGVVSVAIVLLFLLLLLQLQQQQQQQQQHKSNCCGCLHSTKLVFLLLPLLALQSLHCCIYSGCYCCSCDSTVIESSLLFLVLLLSLLLFLVLVSCVLLLLILVTVVLLLLVLLLSLVLILLSLLLLSLLITCLLAGSAEDHVTLM